MEELHAWGGLAQAQKAMGTAAAHAQKGRKNTSGSQASLPSWEMHGGEGRAGGSESDALATSQLRHLLTVKL